MRPQNQAAWQTEPKAKPFKIDDVPMPTAGPNEVVVKTHAVALNPVDWSIQDLGIIIAADAYPTILGHDLAGEVVSVGDHVTAFAPGDRVCGMTSVPLRTSTDGAFKLYSRVSTTLLATIPASVAYTDACVLPACLSTASVGLFQTDTLALPHPTLHPPTSGKVLLIWGGSSSVGSCAIQAAVAAGVDVATTASARNHDYCTDLGATWVFDYHADGVDDAIVAALTGRESVGVLDAWSRGTLARCAAIALRLEGRPWVQSVMPPGMPLAEKIPDGVGIGRVWCTSLTDNAVGPAVWGEWVPRALAAGTLKCKPDPRVVGTGLEALQTACDIGVTGENSATKLVVELVSSDPVLTTDADHVP